MQVRFIPTVKSLLTLCAFFIVIGQTTAQNNFNKGTVIMYDDTQVEGLIQDNDLSIFSRLIAFKEGKKSARVEVLNPEMIKGFITENGQKYEAVAVDYEFETKGGMMHQYSGTRFVRVLQKGTISIYELRDIDARAWFIQKEGQPVELLSLNKKLDAHEVKQLVNTVADCQCIQYDESLPTKIGDVMATVTEYNEFLDSPMFNAAAVLENNNNETDGMEKP